MKKRVDERWGGAGLPIMVLCALLTACAGSPVSRIDSNREAYESWPIEVREAILAGQARKGMTPEQVEVALGRPTEVVTRSATDEIWIYRKGSGLGSSILNNTGISIGGGVGGVGVGTGMGMPRQTPEEYQVIFVNGVVIRSDDDK